MRLPDFSRFLEAVSFSHAAVLNLSDVARDCQVSRTTVEGYLGVLEDLLAQRLRIFTRRARRKLVARPKLYLRRPVLTLRQLPAAGRPRRAASLSGSANPPCAAP